jgi:hypothetical protein
MLECKWVLASSAAAGRLDADASMRPADHEEAGGASTRARWTMSDNMIANTPIAAE